jgi:hypothetical protein
VYDSLRGAFSKEVAEAAKQISTAMRSAKWTYAQDVIQQASHSNDCALHALRNAWSFVADAPLDLRRTNAQNWETVQLTVRRRDTAASRPPDESRTMRQQPEPTHERPPSEQTPQGPQVARETPPTAAKSDPVPPRLVEHEHTMNTTQPMQKSAFRAEVKKLAPGDGFRVDFIDGREPRRWFGNIVRPAGRPGLPATAMYTAEWCATCTTWHSVEGMPGHDSPWDIPFPGVHYTAITRMAQPETTAHCTSGDSEIGSDTEEAGYHNGTKRRSPR